MNCAEYAIQYVQNSDIPDYLLKLGFENANANYNGNWFGVLNQSTVEHGIREHVFHKTVMPKLNVNGSNKEFIDLTGALLRDLGNGCVEVQVPLMFTGGRRITGVVEVYLGSMTSSTGMLSMGVNTSAQCGQGVVNDMMGSLIDSLSPNRNFAPTYTNVRMTGVNTFVIFGINSGTYQMTALCNLEYDEGLSSIAPRHYDYVAEATLLATKAYLFRTARYPVSEAVIRSGVTLDIIKDDIEGYRDAFQMFGEYVDEKLKKRLAYSDKLHKNQMVRATGIRRM